MTPEERAKLRARAEANLAVPHLAEQERVVLSLLDALDDAERVAAVATKVVDDTLASNPGDVAQAFRDGYLSGAIGDKWDAGIALVEQHRRAHQARALSWRSHDYPGLSSIDVGVFHLQTIAEDDGRTRWRVLVRGKEIAAGAFVATATVTADQTAQLARDAAIRWVTTVVDQAARELGGGAS